jgi:Na+-transporting NADH:ubiquinone oxidoreductase subunit NqrB
MAIEEALEIERKQKRLEFARVLVGVAVIVAALAVVLSGVVAFQEGRDAWLAMRRPMAAAILLSWSFARIARVIVSVQRRSAR